MPRKSKELQFKPSDYEPHGHHVYTPQNYSFRGGRRNGTEGQLLKEPPHSARNGVKLKMWRKDLLERRRVLKRDLVALRTGRFGFCEICGDAVEERRLDAIPQTRFCFDCERELEAKSKYTSHAPVRDRPEANQKVPISPPPNQTGREIHHGFLNAAEIFRKSETGQL